MHYEGTEEEILAQKKQRARYHRDARLRATDVYMLADYPISDADREAVKAYRAALRAYPEQAGFPDAALPEKPACMK